MDRGGGCYAADQAAGWEYVSSPFPPLSLPHWDSLWATMCGITKTFLTDTGGVHSSFAQSVCIIGYTLFPIVIAALLSALHLPQIPRIPVYLVLVAWSMAAGVSILGGSGVVKNRVGLAVYPLFVFYLGLGCLCFIS